MQRPAALRFGPWRADLELRATTRTRSSACATRSRAATSTRSTSCSTWRRSSRAIRARSPPASQPLNPHNREPYRGDGWAIVSGSPELFLARRGRRVWTCPIKGTRPAGPAAARELARSAKDAAEHVMIVDLERNDLSRVCEPGSVRWPELMATRALAGVEHMVSTVEGTLRDGVGLAELLAATFPGGSITGAPKIAAVDLIAELEPVGRGASMGALGSRLRQRRPRSGADDPDVRDRRGADPPLGRRRRRLGLGSAGGDRRVVGQGRSAAARDRRAARRARRRAPAVAGRSTPRRMAEPDERGAACSPWPSPGAASSTPASPCSLADDEGFTRGRAAFETMRVYDGRPFRLAAAPRPPPGLGRAHRARAARTRPSSRRSPRSRSSRRRRPRRCSGSTGRRARRAASTARSCSSAPIPDWIEDARARGQRLVSLLHPRRSAPWLLPATKSTSYAVSMAAEAEAKARGADDAVFVDADGIVLEGPVTNIWWREGEVLADAVARGRHPRRRDPRRAARARARARDGSSRKGVYPLERLLARRRGVHVVLGAGGDAGRRDGRASARARPGGRGAAGGACAARRAG